MTDTFWKLYSAIERTFFYTLTRKIIGNIGFLIIFQLIGFILFLAIEDSAPEQRDTLVFWGKVVFGITLLAFGFTIFYLHYLFVRPVKALLNSLNNINSAEADLDTRLPAFTFDEFRQLSESYNTFTAQLKQLLNDIYEGARQAHDSAQQVAHAVADASKHTEQQKRLSDEISQSSAHVTDSISHIVSASELVSESNSSNIDKAQSANQQLENINLKINQIGQLLSKFSGTVSGLQDNANNIKDILKMVQGFADQTNLLALNAAIEAARAGEAGRGFAVVADEVRALSSQVAKATQQITEFIGQMEGLVNETKHESESLVDESEQTRDVIGKTAATFSQMMKDFEQNIAQFNGINDAIHLLNSQHLQTHDNVEQIAQLSDTVRGHIQHAHNESGVAQQQAQQTQQKLGRFQN